MPYQRELLLLESTLKKCRVRTARLKEQEGGEPLPFSVEEPLRPSDAEAGTLYKMTDPYGFCYRYLLLPPKKDKTLLRIGPFLTEQRGKAEQLELFEKLGITAKQQKYFEEYLEGIPVLTEGHPTLLLIDAFCEQLWDTASFAVVDLKQGIPASPFEENAHPSEADSALAVRTMERRYAFENELLEAVSKGQVHKENQLLSALSANLFEKRVADPLRNAKNYGIIMNTLLRKAAESGGVHPLYLDRTSSSFATRIEAIASLSENADLMRDMFRGYCRLVRKHATGKLSPVVGKAVVLVDADLSSNLTLDALAKAVGVSASYLSTAFKRETGTTLTEYVRKKRVKYAQKLLETTHLQIQTVAGHCGMVDVQYFSKVFKAETGQTPLEYRKNIKKTT